MRVIRFSQKCTMGLLKKSNILKRIQSGEVAGLYAEKKIKKRYIAGSACQMAKLTISINVQCVNQINFQNKKRGYTYPRQRKPKWVFGYV